MDNQQSFAMARCDVKNAAFPSVCYWLKGYDELSNACLAPDSPNHPFIRQMIVRFQSVLGVTRCSLTLPCGVFPSPMQLENAKDQRPTSQFILHPHCSTAEQFRMRHRWIRSLALYNIGTILAWPNPMLSARSPPASTT